LFPILCHILTRTPSPNLPLYIDEYTLQPSRVPEVESLCSHAKKPIMANGTIN